MSVAVYKNPVPTVDAVIYDTEKGIVLVKRRNPPYGWALPGGFVDYGETVEQATVREALEETGLKVALTRLLGVYSAPQRDPRLHTISTVFVAIAEDLGALSGGDDALEARFFQLDALPDLVFDHADITQDFVLSLSQKTGANSMTRL